MKTKWIVLMFSAFSGIQRSNMREFEFNLDLEDGSFYSESLKHFRFTAQILIDKLWKDFQKMDLKDDILKSYNYVKKYFPEYSTEIEFISNYTGISINKIWAFQYLYEMYFYCTSIVAKLPNGHILHGRDLDFKFNEISKLAFIAIYKRNNTEQFRCVQFPAFTGAITCIKKGFFALSINARWSSYNRTLKDNLIALQNG